ncbi:MULTISPECIES: alanine dehydrogenase [unclassified Paenibacillus]|uniref:alanine dehydrogenase n=1 Tax=unclassified Paenibacillus TaxID=185978 RepID=UPI001AEABB3C|nr:MULTISPECIES: alanine dehydrogenase [unclassified Paenibacillus]MBP1155170.1 alanine dehydrogenase [Paenibacillus sp. PvP091]MBP1169446.1 alanine dehydrogenase [Paenibacillus sp. PvR098]MBP2440474.1 alanine dehydrogenase [Paenibacillus sp. PvP052]
MIIGIPKEIKSNENRVALTPGGAAMLMAAGHTVLVEAGAGTGSGFSDEDYAKEGGVILPTAAEVWARSEMIMKVKEPLPQEFGYFREGLTLFTYLHLAAEQLLTEALVRSKVTSIAYETIQLPSGTLPLLMPMSEVAGRMSVQVGAQFLEQFYGGRGILLGGVPGVPPADVIILGGGIVGTNAAKMALGLGANVVVIERSADRLRYLDDVFHGRIRTLMSNPYNIANAVQKADLLIGAVLIPGAKAPKLVTEEMVMQMKPGAVIVDVAVDQGGSIATVDRVTTHSQPTYEKHGVIHYAVANMPGAVPRTSTLALTNVTISYALELAGKGVIRALYGNPPLKHGVNTYKGHVTHSAVAEAVGIPFTGLDTLLPIS